MIIDPQPRTAEPPAGRSEHRVSPGRSDDLLFRVYAPGTGEGPYPALVYFHYGGFVIANLADYDSSCRALAHMAGCVVVTVAYRQAPEQTILAAVEVVVAAYRWMTAHVAEFDVDPGRIAVGGDGVGENLNAVVAQIARDQGLPAPIHQLLAYPMTDRGFDAPSAGELVAAAPGTRDMMTWSWGRG